MYEMVGKLSKQAPAVQVMIQDLLDRRGKGSTQSKEISLLVDDGTIVSGDLDPEVTPRFNNGTLFFSVTQSDEHLASTRVEIGEAGSVHVYGEVLIAERPQASLEQYCDGWELALTDETSTDHVLFARLLWWRLGWSESSDHARLISLAIRSLARVDKEGGREDRLTVLSSMARGFLDTVIRSDELEEIREPLRRHPLASQQPMINRYLL